MDSEFILAVTITASTCILLLFIIAVALIIKVISIWRETPRKERKGLKCLAGIHEWRYVKLPSRLIPGYNDYLHRPLKVFSTSYYNKKVSFHVKYCLKCLRFKAEKA